MGPVRLSLPSQHFQLFLRGFIGLQICLAKKSLLYNDQIEQYWLILVICPDLKIWTFEILWGQNHSRRTVTHYFSVVPTVLEKPWRNIVHFSLRLNAMPSLRLPWPLLPPLRLNLTAAYKQPRYYGAAAAPPPLSLRMGGAEWRQLIIPFFCRSLLTHLAGLICFFGVPFYVHFMKTTFEKPDL